MGGCLGIVLARAGSKGLAGKNQRVVAGRLMAEWTLMHAAGTAGVDVIALSTDSETLLAAAQQTWPAVRLVRRPAELAGDTATVADAARHALFELEQQRGATFDDVVLWYANVPVRPADLTQRALQLLRQSGCDSVQSVCDVGKHHPYWMRRVDAAGVMTAYVENNIDRRQDLPAVYELDGGVIALRRDGLANAAGQAPHAMLGGDRRAIVTQRGEVVDVDDAMDLAVVEAILSKQSEGMRQREAA